MQLKGRSSILFACCLLLTLGPLRALALTPQQLLDSVTESEKRVEGILPDNEARLSLVSGRESTKTPWAVLYLHGFSASPMETSPLTENLAKALGAHLYMPRFRGHGLKDPEGLTQGGREIWEREAALFLEQAYGLGEKVLVIATSTGASWVVPSAALHPRKNLSFVFLSPNFGLKPPLSSLLLWPGARTWAPWIVGYWREWKPDNPLHGRLATTRYPSKVLVEVAHSAASAYRVARENPWPYPTLVVTNPKDPVVDSAASKRVFSTWPSATAFWLEFTKAENPHVLAGAMVSPSGTGPITKAILEFMRKNESQ